MVRAAPDRTTTRDRATPSEVPHVSIRRRAQAEQLEEDAHESHWRAFGQVLGELLSVFAGSVVGLGDNHRYYLRAFWEVAVPGSSMGPLSELHRSRWESLVAQALCDELAQPEYGWRMAESAAIGRSGLGARDSKAGPVWGQGGLSFGPEQPASGLRCTSGPFDMTCRCIDPQGCAQSWNSASLVKVQFDHRALAARRRRSGIPMVSPTHNERPRLSGSSTATPPGCAAAGRTRTVSPEVSDHRPGPSHPSLICRHPAPR